MIRSVFGSGFLADSGARIQSLFLLLLRIDGGSYSKTILQQIGEVSCESWYVLLFDSMSKPFLLDIELFRCHYGLW